MKYKIIYSIGGTFTPTPTYDDVNLEDLDFEIDNLVMENEEGKENEAKITYSKSQIGQMLEELESMYISDYYEEIKKNKKMLVSNGIPIELKESKLNKARAFFQYTLNEYYTSVTQIQGPKDMLGSSVTKVVPLSREKFYGYIEQILTWAGCDPTFRPRKKLENSQIALLQKGGKDFYTEKKKYMAFITKYFSDLVGVTRKPDSLWKKYSDKFPDSEIADMYEFLEEEKGENKVKLADDNNEDEFGF